MEYNTFLENLTITFSGHNIRENIQLAVESLLEFHPEVKKNIVVFDDDSTDGTKEWLKKNNIKRITWSEEKRKELRDFNKESILSYWNDVMIQDIMNQVKTKYILINDGDVVFLKKFLENFAKKIDDYKALLVISRFTDAILKERCPFKSLQKYKIINDYYDQFSRVHIFHGLLDLEFFKKENIYFDDIKDKEVAQSLQSNDRIINGPFGDGGLDFLYQLLSKNIAFYDLKYWDNFENNHIYHLSWRSSYVRRKYISKEFREYLIEHLDKDINKNPKIGEMLKKFNYKDIAMAKKSENLKIRQEGNNKIVIEDPKQLLDQDDHKIMAKELKSLCEKKGINYKYDIRQNKDTGNVEIKIFEGPNEKETIDLMIDLFKRNEIELKFVKT